MQISNANGIMKLSGWKANRPARILIAVLSERFDWSESTNQDPLDPWWKRMSDQRKSGKAFVTTRLC